MCIGNVDLPREGDTFVAEPAENVTISWRSYWKEEKVFARIWTFESSDGRPKAILATTFGNENPVISKIGLPGVEIRKPATLVLRNVDRRYNGTYIFNLGASEGGTSNVTYATLPVTLLVVGKVHRI